MKLSLFSTATRAFIKAKILKRKVPLAVSWALTFRCNQQCLYCGIWKQQCLELGTSEILDMISQFRQLGTRWISFTGGEPLLRDDLGKMLKYTKDQGIRVRISSNGKLVPQKIDQLKCVDGIKLSLDGPESINDHIRGEGSFRDVVQAIKICQIHQIPVYLECTISKFNIDTLDWVVKFAKDLGLIVMFQPATQKLLWSKDLNPISAPPDQYRIAVSKLMNWKKKKAPIFNSLAGLRHLYFWPDAKRIYCSAGLLSLDIEPDGTILSCDTRGTGLLRRGRDKLDIKSVLANMKATSGCSRCWCSSLVEFNLICALNLDAISNYLRRPCFVKNNRP